MKIMFLFGIWATYRSHAASTCDTYASCAEAAPGTEVLDPQDCHNFYTCIIASDGNGNELILPSDNPQSCPDGTYFDQSTSECETEVTPCFKPCPNHQCRFECDESSSETDYIADPSDCSRYFVCIQDLDPVKVTCPDNNPYFNGTICTSNPESCCDACVPYCEHNFVETIDPYDCESYYLCMTDGVPSGDDHFMCDEGEYFNPSSSSCVAYAVTEKCNPLCSDFFPSTTPRYTTESTVFSTSEIISESSRSTTNEVPTSTSAVTSTETSLFTETSAKTSYITTDKATSFTSTETTIETSISTTAESTVSSSSDTPGTSSFTTDEAASFTSTEATVETSVSTTAESTVSSSSDTPETSSFTTDEAASFTSTETTTKPSTSTTTTPIHSTSLCFCTAENSDIPSTTPITPEN